MMGRGNGKPIQCIQKLIRYEFDNVEILKLHMEGWLLKDIGTKLGVGYQCICRRLDAIEDKTTELLVKGVSEEEIAYQIGCDQKHIGAFIKQVQKKYK